jgi:hypothetical protein
MSQTLGCSITVVQTKAVCAKLVVVLRMILIRAGLIGVWVICDHNFLRNLRTPMAQIPQAKRIVAGKAIGDITSVIAHR